MRCAEDAVQPPDSLERVVCAWRAVRFRVRRVLVGGDDHHHLARPEDRHGCSRQSAAGSASRVGVVQGVCVRARHVRVDACMRVGAYVRACVYACVRACRSVHVNASCARCALVQRGICVGCFRSHAQYCQGGSARCAALSRTAAHSSCALQK